MFLGGIPQINPNKNISKILKYSDPKELEELIQSEKIVGLKLHTSATRTRVDDDSLDDFLVLAVHYDLPFVFHCSATGTDFTHPDYFRNLKTKQTKEILQPKQ